MNILLYLVWSYTRVGWNILKVIYNAMTSQTMLIGHTGFSFVVSVQSWVRDGDNLPPALRSEEVSLAEVSPSPCPLCCLCTGCFHHFWGIMAFKSNDKEEYDVMWFSSSEELHSHWSQGIVFYEMWPRTDNKDFMAPAETMVTSVSEILSDTLPCQLFSICFWSLP